MNVFATDLVNITDSTIDVAVVEVNDSLNNVNVLNNVLNNSPILSGIDVDINVEDVNVLNDSVKNILNNNDINIDDVIGVSVLSGGDLIVFQ